MEVRQAGIQDFPRIVKQAGRFNDTYYGVAPLNEDKVLDWLGFHLEHGAIFCTDAGFILGAPVVDPIRDWTILSETAWYSEGKCGLRLLDSFVRYGRETACDEVRITTLSTTPAGVTTILQRYKFGVAETHHRLIL